jgi:hypothetical protein
LHWQADLKSSAEYSFESANWNMPDLFSDYFQRRWVTERKKLAEAEKNQVPYDDFLYAPATAKQKCTQLGYGSRNWDRDDKMPF